MRPTDIPLPPDAELPPNWQEIDAFESYNAAIAAIGERVRAGEPVPEFMRSRKASP